MRKMTYLDELARKYETDKGGQHFRYGGGDSDTNHNYCEFYDELFREERDLVRHVLEIGINAGSSLRMWEEYFPNAKIVGLDSDAKCLVHDTDRISCYAADQNNPQDLYKVMRAVADRPTFDLIIDDGSHIREHQVTSMKTLLPFLSSWGYYIIEDLGTGPDVDFKPLIDAVPPGYSYQTIQIHDGWGPKVQPYEWLFVVEHEDNNVPGG